MSEIRLTVKPAEGLAKDGSYQQGWAVFSSASDKPVSFVLSSKERAELTIDFWKELWALPNDDSPETDELHRMCFLKYRN